MYSSMFSPICFYNFISKTVSFITTITLGVGISVVIISLYIGKNNYKTHRYLLDEQSSSDENSSDGSEEDKENENQNKSKNKEKYEDKYKR